MHYAQYRFGLVIMIGCECALIVRTVVNVLWCCDCYTTWLDTFDQQLQTLNVSSNAQQEPSTNNILKPREQHFQQQYAPYCKAANKLKLQ
jgi:hypothetical protein